MGRRSTSTTHYGGKILTSEATEAILTEFKRANRLDSSFLPHSLRSAIVAASHSYFSLVEHAHEVDMTDPTVGLLLAYSNRTYDTVCGALALMALGHFRDAEILGRTIFESSATLTYICLQRETRFLQYFQHYLRQERDQLRKWSDEAKKLSLDKQAEQLPYIERRAAALELYAGVIRDFASMLKIDLATLSPLANLPERLGEFGNRLDYRTFYASMCSQSHHDGEDLLNYFIAGSAGAEFLKQSAAETNSFSVFMTLFALKYFVSAIGAVSIVLKFSDTTARCEASRTHFDEALQKILPHLENATFPLSWQLPNNSP